MNKEINDGHYLEMMDRIHIMMATLYDHMISHPVSNNHKKVDKRLNKALNILWDTYQIVGDMNFKKQEKNEAIKKVISRRHKNSKN